MRDLLASEGYDIPPETLDKLTNMLGMPRPRDPFMEVIEAVVNYTGKPEAGTVPVCECGERFATAEQANAHEEANDYHFWYWRY